ncbi:MAG TPA: inositol monophosphatase family protein [Longimicrobiales bacterium]|nr:inositol monophosphatase family protein [Longimicrobiales bacterium]
MRRRGDAVIPELLEAAEAFAREAGEVTLRWFGPRLEHEEKGDGTPVTRADREAERLLRTRIAARFPGHAILGEEEGEERSGARIRWIVDPIDGTKAFMRGVPLYGVLVGVEADDEPVVGVAHFPALGETVAAARGRGCRWDGRPCRVSQVGDLERALVLTTDPERVLVEATGAGWPRMQGRAGLCRTWGDAYGHVLVATGRAEVMVDPVLSPWDAAPLLTILTEAGGRFTDLGGEPTIHGGSGVSSNGLLHDAVLEELAGE